ncbi:MAG: MaoC family dehydratase [Halieaceae bacterium]|nr:MaoC family dehydratase [Halieaceae bacterium]MCP4466648.1 MaoC family dehydratase [Halieaceae bacterium]MCP4843329.1 MaoC family dehydratase [Halieaceae bacterium]MDG2410302.1 MaoC family dehydratase [Halioglobus sp.]
MKQYQYDDIEALQELVSDDFGAWSEPLEVSQDLVNQFADLTGDHNWIHVDVEKSRTDSPFGTTIAHGFLTLVLMPKMRGKAAYELTGFNSVLNYGSDKLRFTGPVPVGSLVHSRNRVREVSASPKGTKMVLEQHIHVVGQDERPVLIYELIIIYV